MIQDLCISSPKVTEKYLCAFQLGPIRWSLLRGEVVILESKWLGVRTGGLCRHFIFGIFCLALRYTR